MASPAPAPAAAAPATTNAIKVFVGNLSFKTRDAELQQAFESAGKVVRAKVIRDYNRRSLGYGFVEMATLEEAKKAVEMMNKKEIDTRPINVELAKPRDENAIQQERQQQQQQGGNQEGGRGRGASSAPRGARGGRGRGRGGAPRPAGSPTSNNGQPQEDRNPSKTTLFVSNLPFTMEDAAFTALFTAHKFNVKKATVVKRQNGKSKGFGFVEFDNEDTQQKALAAVNGQELEGRKLTVRVALTELRDNPAPTAQGTGKQEVTAQPPATQQVQPKKESSSPAPTQSAPPKQEKKPTTTAPAAEKKQAAPKKQ